jgi:hypothetical protein
MNTVLKSTLAALIVAMTAGIAHAGSEVVLTLKPESNGTTPPPPPPPPPPPNPHIGTGKRINSAQDDASGYTFSFERFINVPGMSAKASDVQVVISYRDDAGGIQVISTGVYEDGCQAEETDFGVDVVCAIVFAQ